MDSVSTISTCTSRTTCILTVTVLSFQEMYFNGLKMVPLQFSVKN